MLSGDAANHEPEFRIRFACVVEFHCVICTGYMFKYNCNHDISLEESIMASCNGADSDRTQIAMPRRVAGKGRGVVHCACVKSRVVVVGSPAGPLVWVFMRTAGGVLCSRPAILTGVQSIPSLLASFPPANCPILMSFKFAMIPSPLTMMCPIQTSPSA